MHQDLDNDVHVGQSGGTVFTGLPHTAQRTMNDAHCTMQNAHAHACTEASSQNGYRLHNAQCTVHNEQCRRHKAQCTRQCPMHSAQCTMHNAQSIHDAQCKMRNAQCKILLINCSISNYAAIPLCRCPTSIVLYSYDTGTYTST